MSKPLSMSHNLGVAGSPCLESSENFIEPQTLWLG
jgi:hypothetical protein